jgi:hypothetical protein
MANFPPISLATATKAGLVKSGTGLAVAGDGTLNAIATGPYLGQFAGQCRAPTTSTAGASATQVMSRTRHISRNNVSTVQVAFPNWIAVSNNGGLETGLGAPATITAAVEYGGVSYPLKWSGASSVAVPDLSNSPLSDPIFLAIPDGAAFFIRGYFVNPNGIIYEAGGTGTEALDSTNGESFRFALSGLADQTTAVGATTGGSTSGNLRYGPSLLVSRIIKPSILIVGTSIDMGFRETVLASGGVGGANGDKGITSRPISPVYGYSNVAQGGASALNFLTLANRAVRMTMAPYFSHVLSGHAINDLIQTSDSVTVIAARLTAIAALFTIPVWGTTCTPYTTGAWTLVDGTDQTIYSSNSFATRLPALNTLIRSGIIGYAGYFDVADGAMSSRDSNKWYANGTAAYMTPEGLHPTTAGSEYVRSRLVIDPTWLKR